LLYEYFVMENVSVWDEDFFKEWAPLYVYRTGTMVKVCIECVGDQNVCVCMCIYINTHTHTHMRARSHTHSFWSPAHSIQTFAILYIYSGVVCNKLTGFSNYWA